MNGLNYCSESQILYCETINTRINKVCQTELSQPDVKMTKVIAIILLISNVFGEKNTVCHPKERLSQCYSEMEQNPINSTNMAMIRIKRGSGYLTARSDIISGTSRMSIKRPPFTLVGGVITNLSIRLELHNGRLSGSINVNDGPHSGSLTRARKKASDFGKSNNV